MWLFGKRTAVIECVLTKDTSPTISAAVDLGGCELIGLILPTIITGDVTFTVCDTLAGTYVALKAKGGTALTITAGTGNFAVASDDLAPLAAYRFVKIVTAGTQTSNVTFKFIVKV